MVDFPLSKELEIHNLTCTIYCRDFILSMQYEALIMLVTLAILLAIKLFWILTFNIVKLMQNNL
jgi:hypothetical protein